MFLRLVAFIHLKYILAFYFEGISGYYLLLLKNFTVLSKFPLCFKFHEKGTIIILYILLKLKKEKTTQKEIHF